MDSPDDVQINDSHETFLWRTLFLLIEDHLVERGEFAHRT
jgi:hypothetical protein